jgi:hypothetical protein
MANASTLGDMSPGLLKVVKRAQREPEGRFHSLAHLIDVPALVRAYHRQRAEAAGGVDGITKEQYGRNLATDRKYTPFSSPPPGHTARAAGGAGVSRCASRGTTGGGKLG